MLRLAWNPLARATEAVDTTRFEFDPSRLPTDRMGRGGVERALEGLLPLALFGLDPVSVMELAGETTGKD